MPKKIAIIGAGASGMMLAATLVELGFSPESVSLFERNPRMGKKVAITGGGRCNVTTGIRSKKELLSKYVRGGDFLEGVLWAFSPKKTAEWFAAHGCPLKTQDDLRVFPVSDSADEVVAVFERALGGIDLRLSTKVEGVRVKKGEGGRSEFFVSHSETHERFDALVISTGWAAYSKTGSDGSGHALAKSLGHPVTPLRPSLSAYETLEDWTKGLSGLAIPRAKLFSEGASFSEWGLLFTHFGITGPAVFELSARLAFTECSPSMPIFLRISPDASRTFDHWEAEISNAFFQNGAKEWKNVLSLLLPRRLSETVVALSGVSGEKKCATVSREERKSVCRLLSLGIPVTLVGTRPGEEFVTAWGIDTSFVDSATMESKLIENLYFTGEVLDVDAVTGGFNLQSCWSTGRAAGRAIAEKFGR